MLDFNDALELLRQGKKVKRKGSMSYIQLGDFDLKEIATGDKKFSLRIEPKIFHDNGTGELVKKDVLLSFEDITSEDWQEVVETEPTEPTEPPVTP